MAASEFILRDYQSGDEAALIEIWQSGFEDTDEEIRSFFERFQALRLCRIAEADGRPVAAFYLLDGPTLWGFRKKKFKAAYAYALATLPAYRKQGIGTALAKDLREKAFASGYDVVCTTPSEASLFDFYRNAGFNQPLTSVREQICTRPQLKALPRPFTARIRYDEYLSLRESMLEGETHAEFPAEYYEELNDFIDDGDGGFFMTESGIAAAETRNGVCTVHELLSSAGKEAVVAAAIGAFCPAEQYIIKTPAFWEGEGEIKPQVLAAVREGITGLPDDLWFGITLQ